MLNKISYKLSNIVAVKTGSDEDSREVYQYALELILSTVIGFAAILAVASITIGIQYGIVFLVFFSALRSVAGGYHADTYLKCFCVSVAMFVGVVVVCEVLMYFAMGSRWLILPAIAAGVYIIFRAPVLHPNQPLSEKRVQKNKQVAKVIVLVELIAVCGLALTRLDLMLIAVLSICLVTLLMLPSDRKNWGKEHGK